MTYFNLGSIIQTDNNGKGDVKSRLAQVTKEKKYIPILLYIDIKESFLKVVHGVVLQGMKHRTVGKKKNGK